MHSTRLRTSLTAAIATAGAVALTLLGTAGTAVAAPSSHPNWSLRHFRSCIRVEQLTSGAFSNNNDILKGWIVRGSVSVVATQGVTPGQDNPEVQTFGPGTGYTVAYTRSGAVATLQSPYAGSNDGFTTYYSVFRQVCFIPWWRYHLVTLTSGAFSNNNDVLVARNLIRGSVFVIATLGPPPPFDSPSVNGFMQYSGYTVTYTRSGAVATLQPPFAGSNDGFTTYYTVLANRY
jgi:hypothetical protein